MNLTAWAVFGLALGPGQPPAPRPEPQGVTVGTVRGVQPARSRSQFLEPDYDEFTPAERANISHAELIVSRDQGQTWATMDTARPDQKELNLKVAEDGLYFVNVVVNFRDGRRVPSDPTQVAPQYKMLIDSTPPVVRIDKAERDGDDVTVAWVVEDSYPDEAATQVLYKAAGNPLNEWTPVPAGSVDRRSARFRPTIAGPLLVRVRAADLAENTADVAKEVPGGVVTAGYAPPGLPPSVALPTPRPVEPTPPAPMSLPPREAPPVTPTTGTPLVVPPAPVAAAPFSPTPTPTLPITPPSAGPILPPPTPTLPITPPPAAPFMLPSPPMVTAAPTVSVPTWTPPAVPAPRPPEPQPVPLPTFGGGETFRPAAAAAPEPPARQSPAYHLKSPDFDLRYEVENSGPSGLSRVDLYVTRDDGRSWMKWSSHAATERPLKVRLSGGATAADGEYGLKLVPVSGVGLADDAPAAGTPPEHRIVIDTVAPELQVYPHAVAPSHANAVLLNYVARDANFGETPVTIEWGESPAGPWHAVNAPDGHAAPAAVPAPLANAGQYLWTLPPGMPTHRVHLRLTATDRAGNVTKVVTREPITVDLVKPKARIIFPTGVEVSPRR